MGKEPAKLTTKELLAKYREAVVYTALSNNGADQACLVAEAELASELERRLKAAEESSRLGARANIVRT